MSGISDTEQQLVSHKEWFNRSWAGQVGRVETFLRPRESGMSPLKV